MPKKTTYPKTVAFRLSAEQWAAIQYVSQTQPAFQGNTSTTLRVMLAEPLRLVVDSYRLAHPEASNEG